jgi:hypothetical protein
LDSMKRDKGRPSRMDDVPAERLVELLDYVSQVIIVRDASTKKCTVVDTKPTTTTVTVVGDGVYKTKTEAEAAVKTTKVCTE